MMDEAFLAVARLLCISGESESGRSIPTDEFITILRDDPQSLEHCRAYYERFLTTANRSLARDLLQLLHATTAYVSRLLGGPVPVLVPRENLPLVSAAAGEADMAAATVIARSFRQLVQLEAAKDRDKRDQNLLAKIEEAVSNAGLNVAPSNGRYLNTEQVGRILNLAPKTVRKLFNQGQLVGRKLKGGEWRTTQADLDRSAYLQAKNGRARAKVE